MLKTALISAAALSALAACAAIQPARMAAPAPLIGATETVEITGIGGGQRGSFQVAGHSGTFSRSDNRLAFFNLVESRYGHTDFTLAGPSINATIEARCTMGQRNITIGPTEFTAKPLAYVCEFTNEGRAIPARFELQEVREGLGGALGRNERRGEIALDRVILQLRSVHDIEGSPFKTASPMGYVFEMEGRPVGAVDLNGRPRLMLPPEGGDPAVRRAIIAGALAVALFWDPAENPLAD